MNWKYKLLLTIVVIILLVPLIAYFVFQSSYVQSYLTDRITSQFSEQLQTTFRIGGIDIKLFSSVVLEDVYLEDQQQDTLLYTQKLDASIAAIRPLRKEFKLNKILLDSPKLRLRKDSTYTNYEFILEALSGDQDTTSGGSFNIWCDDFELKNAEVSYQSQRHDTIAGFDSGNLHLSDINFTINDIQVGDTIRFSLTHFSLNNKGPADIENLLLKAHLSPNEKRLENVVLLTGESNVVLDKFIWKQRPDTTGDFFQNNDFMLDIAEGSLISGEEISYFLPDSFPAFKDLEISGKVESRHDSVTAASLKILYGGASMLALEGNASGIFSDNTIRGDVKLNQLLVQKSHIAEGMTPFIPARTIKHIESMQAGNFVKFKGRVFGSMQNIFLNGKLQSGKGHISSDLNIKSDTSGNLQAINGQVFVHDMPLGAYLLNPSLGNVSLESSFNNLKIDKNQPGGQFNINLHQAVYEGKSYENLEIDGKFKGKTLDLQALMNDKAINFSLKSRVMLKNNPVYRLTLKLRHADFVKTGIDTAVDRSHLAMNINAYLKGKSIGDISGDVVVSDVVFQRDTNKVLIDKLTIGAMQSAFKQKSITFKSPLLDMKINGRFDYQILPPTLKTYLHGIFPRAVPLPANPQVAENNQQRFRYSITFHKINALLDAFQLNSSVAPQTTISGNFNNQKQRLNVSIRSEEITLFGNTIKGFDLEGTGTDDYINLALKNESFKAGDIATFNQFDLAANAQNDSLRLIARWKSSGKNAPAYKGEIKTTAYFRELPSSDNLKFNINIHPSYFVIADTMWTIQPTMAEIHPNMISISPFQIRHNNQYLAIGGKLSSNPQDSLKVDVRKFALSHTDVLLKNSGIELDGLLQGSIVLTDVFNTPFVALSNKINNMKLNGRSVGDLTFNAGYNAEANNVSLDSYIKEKNIKNFKLKGNYHIEDDELDFSLDMKNLSLNLFNPFLEGTVSDIAGLASTDNISVKGSASRPVLEGDVFMQKAAFRIDYLNTRYSFTDSVSFSERKVNFNSIELHDRHNNTALLAGSINHDYFQDMQLNLSVSLNNFKALNTTSEDNQDFYGEAYASGIINLTGTPDDIVINVSATTEKNTRFFIPLSSGGEISENKFITFASDTASTTNRETISPENFEVDISGIQLNFDMNVTPDANISLILNEATGDVLQSRGNGSLRLVIDTRGQFNMYGDYNIQQGNYVFNLQNVVSKKFDIQEGSSIKWDGSPYNAQIDITTVYTVKNALLYDLTLQNKYKETRVPAQCVIELENQLTSPAIDFGISIADSYQGYAETDQIESQLENLPQEELNKQFLSLLIINRFQPLPGFSSAQGNLASNTGLGLSSSASELLTSQLSSWMSQISDDLNVGINYNSSDSLSNSELEVALSTQLLNDRFLINGNLSMGDQYANPDNYFGNFDVEYKITQNGKLRVKYYNKTDNDLIYNEAPTKQGLGIFYHEDFNTFGSLMKRYRESLIKFRKQLFNNTKTKDKE